MSSKKQSASADNGIKQVAKATNGRKKTATPGYKLLPGEKADIRAEAATLIENADEWLDAPNASFGGQKPSELIGTDREWFLRNLFRRMKHGMPT